MSYDHKAEEDPNSLDHVLFGRPNPRDPPSHPLPHKAKQRSKHTRKPDTGASTKKSGHWTNEENKRYHWFLELYNSYFVNKHRRRTEKIFKTMETFIGTREAEQCRSHHQKMEKKYKNFKQILLHLRNLHYATDDHTSVAEDLRSNEVALVDDPLVTAEYLHQPFS